jgi:hypothetical protein
VSRQLPEDDGLRIRARRLPEPTVGEQRGGTRSRRHASPELLAALGVEAIADQLYAHRKLPLGLRHRHASRQLHRERHREARIPELLAESTT